MNIWRKLKIKIKNRWNDQEYRQAMISTLIVIIVLFTYLVLSMINMMVKNNAYGKLLPWLKMLSFSVFHVFSFILFVSIIPGYIPYKLNKIMYNEKSLIIWFPFINIYMLGKLTINKVVGIILVVCSELLMAGKVYCLSYLTVIILLNIYAIIKYNKIKKQKY